MKKAIKCLFVIMAIGMLVASANAKSTKGGGSSVDLTQATKMDVKMFYEQDDGNYAGEDIFSLKAVNGIIEGSHDMPPNTIYGGNLTIKNANDQILAFGIIAQGITPEQGAFSVKYTLNVNYIDQNGDPAVRSVEGYFELEVDYDPAVKVTICGQSWNVADPVRLHDINIDADFSVCKSVSISIDGNITDYGEVCDDQIWIGNKILKAGDHDAFAIVNGENINIMPNYFNPVDYRKYADIQFCDQEEEKSDIGGYLQ